MVASSPHRESGKESSADLEAGRAAPLTVRQPERIQSLLLVLADLDRIAERVSEDRSHDLGSGAQTGATGNGAAAVAGVSLRQQAIQSLPTPPVMRRRLAAHLEREIHHLEREARRLGRSARKGSAYFLAQTYARIRKIQALITDLLEATAEMIERLYIRLFIDHQQLV